MKELILQYAAYNLWANKRIAEVLLQAGDKLNQEMVSSFPSIRATVLHIWSAESIWLQRLQHVEEPIWQQGGFAGDFSELCSEWLLASEALIRFAEQMEDDGAFREMLIYHNRAKKEHHNPVYQVLHHVFNHSTYHRGQLVTMLRQTGRKEIPGIDFIGFAWEQ